MKCTSEINVGNKRLGRVSYLKLLRHNIHLHGYKSLVYSYGLASARFIEYTTVLRFLEGKNVGKILDIGCGHSLLPSLLAANGFEVVAVDTNESSLAWQRSKAKGDSFKAVVGNGLNLPFADESFSVVISISVIEHLENKGDTQAMKEIARVLEDGGLCIVSTGVSPRGGQTTAPLFGIPSWYRYLLGTGLIHRVLKKFGVDRGENYFERFYSRQEIQTRVIEPSGCSLEEYISYWDWVGTRVLYRIVPKASISILELFLAEVSSHASKKPTHLGGIVLKLRKSRASL